MGRGSSQGRKEGTGRRALGDFGAAGCLDLGAGKRQPLGGRGQQRGAGVGVLTGHWHAARLCWVPWGTRGTLKGSLAARHLQVSWNETPSFIHNTIVKSWGTLLTPSPTWPFCQCHWSSGIRVAPGFRGESDPDTGCVGVSAEEGHPRWTKAWRGYPKRPTSGSGSCPGKPEETSTALRGPAAGGGLPASFHIQGFATNPLWGEELPLPDSHPGCYSKGSEKARRGETACVPSTLPTSLAPQPLFQ